MNTIKQLKNKVNNLTNIHQRAFANSLYMWNAPQTAAGTKAGSIRQRRSLTKGVPQRLSFYDELDPQTLRIGMKHSAVIDKDGGLWMFGSGNWGVLGQGNEDDHYFSNPVKVDKFDKLGLKVVDVQLGEAHTMALTNDGNIWTWGYGGKEGYFSWMVTQESGALGHGDKKPHFVPTKVRAIEKAEIKVKSISTGLYHCNVLDDKGDIYTWGRGLYGVLGNGANSTELEPILNEDVKAIMDEDENNKIVKMRSADEYTIIQVSDGSLYAWGKNDRGQMGTQVGIGIDMVECENVPTYVELKDPQEMVTLAQNFAVGQNSSMVQDTDNNLYQVGQKLYYTPTQLAFTPDFLDKDNVDIMACGRKHYIITTKDKKIYAWGNVFKEQKGLANQEGFNMYHGDTLFDDGTIEHLEVKYNIFGAIVKH